MTAKNLSKIQVEVGDGSGDKNVQYSFSHSYAGHVHPNGSSGLNLSQARPNEVFGWGFACNMFSRYDVDGSVDLCRFRDNINWNDSGFLIPDESGTGVRYRDDEES